MILEMKAKKSLFIYLMFKQVGIGGERHTKIYSVILTTTH